MNELTPQQLDAIGKEWEMEQAIASFDEHPLTIPEDFSWIPYHRDYPSSGDGFTAQREDKGTSGTSPTATTSVLRAADKSVEYSPDYPKRTDGDSTLIAAVCLGAVGLALFVTFIHWVTA